MIKNQIVKNATFPSVLSGGKKIRVHGDPAHPIAKTRSKMLRTNPSPKASAAIVFMIFITASVFVSVEHPFGHL